MSAERTRGLGRGLSALISEGEADTDNRQTSSENKSIRTLPIEQIHANPDQPRRNFDDADIASLAESIADKGVLQPILVRPSPKGDGYQIVAGLFYGFHVPRSHKAGSTDECEFLHKWGFLLVFSNFLLPNTSLNSCSTDNCITELP